MQIGKEMAIPSILKIGNGALGKIGSYLKTEGLDQVVLFFGNGLIDMFGELVMNSLKEADVNVLEYNELDTVDIDDIITLAFAIPNKAKAVISIGGGKVIDAGKYAAFLRNLPFISVPTSSSSDGFSSASASLLVQGKRTSVPARLAYGIIVDTQVIRTAPEKFIYSGIGDMISKIIVPLAADETGGSLFDKLAEAGAKLLIATLPHIFDGTAVYEKQPEESPTPYAGMITKQMGLMDFRKSAEELERLVRGLNPWPSAYTFLNGKTLKVWKCKVSTEKTDAVPGTIFLADKEGIHTACGEGVLILTEVQLEGKKRMETEAFLRGYHIENGIVFTDHKE